MICNIPQTEAWKSHLTARAEEALRIGLLTGCEKLAFLSTAVFFPDELDKKLLNSVKPNYPLRDILNKKRSLGWVKRDDLINESAKYIFEKYSTLYKAELFFEAGYSKQGDKVLDNRQHIIFKGLPFLNQKISEASSDIIAQTLRWARSRRLLGVVADMSICQTFSDNGMNRLLFVCDVFDGDSILVSVLHK